MKTSTYLYDARPSGGFQVTAVRYTPENTPSHGLTLILAHANATHKETWGPLVSFLFKAAENNVFNVNIREAWSIECPNHGESAVLNEREINARYPEHWDGWVYPRSMLAFLNSRPGGIDFYERNLIALGHSHGGNSLVLLHDLQPRLRFEAFILLDPTIGRESAAKDHMQRILTHLTWTKQDTWASRKAAWRDLSSQPGFRNWHPQVLDAFVAKGIRDHPAKAYPDPWTFKGVTLACTKTYEHALTRSNDHYPRAYTVFHELYRHGPPVHLILSRADEFDGAQLKEDMVAPDPVSQRGATSIQWIEKGGHMFVQSMPEPTAKAIWNALLIIENKISAQPEVENLPRARL